MISLSAAANPALWWLIVWAAITAGDAAIFCAARALLRKRKTRNRKRRVVRVRAAIVVVDDGETAPVFGDGRPVLFDQCAEQSA